MSALRLISRGPGFGERRFGDQVGLFLLRVRAGHDARWRRRVLLGPGHTGLRRLFCRLPGGSAGLLHARVAIRSGYAGRLGQCKMHLRMSTLWLFDCGAGGHIDVGGAL
jgi:hypothetical protein